MNIFQSISDIFLDSILDMDELSDLERQSLIISCYGVPFNLLSKNLKDVFRSAIVKYVTHHQSLYKFYERG